MKRLQIWMRTSGVLTFFLFIFSIPPPNGFAQLPAPPMLLSPDNEAVIESPTPAFFWTPAQSVPGKLLFYRFRVVHLMPDQNPKDAIVGNKPHHEQIMRKQGYQYPTDASSLKQGETYAWGVQVITRDQTPMATNGGWTDVSTISMQTAEEPPPADDFVPVHITTEKLKITGIRFQPVSITTDPLTVTGLRFNSVLILTDTLTVTGIQFPPVQILSEPLTVTGLRFNSVSILTEPLTVTGIRFQPIHITTEEMTVTGTRFNPIQIATDRLTVTGIRDLTVESDEEGSDKREEELPLVPVIKKIIEKIREDDKPDEPASEKSE